MEKETEKDSDYRHLEKMSTKEILYNINSEDHKVAPAVKKVIPQIIPVVEAATLKLKEGGRLFYVGSGTSGRLGIVDASECPPTFGVPHDKVIGLIAGGDAAIRKAKEFAEDDMNQGWKDLREFDISSNDFVIGITASGTTPYVLGAVNDCRKNNVRTAGITCNKLSPLSALVDFPIEVIVGPEFVTGSTRMKAGTAQKMILNLISTSVMIKIGRIKDNKMVDMQLSNQKLIERGTRMLMELLNIGKEDAKKLLLEKKSVRTVIENYRAKDER